MSRTILVAGAVVAALSTFAASNQACWAQDDPTRQWIICYGPQANGRLDQPKKIYVSGISTAVRVTGNTAVLVTKAFHDLILQKYGADFGPRCDWYSTAEQAQRYLKYMTSQPTPEAVSTGWVWTQPESDKHPPPPPPGAVNGH